MGRGPLAGGQSGRRKRRRRFSPLDAAVRAGMDAGDGSGHRQRLAVISADFGGNRGNPQFGDLRAGGDREQPASVARPARNFFFLLGRRFTGNRSTLPGPARFA
ncbi:hypothetical protein CRG98_004817 [Punica granatum]|uniref:Uncharacterized protein n=1 Tax=Punica granatum TaxID=22663 RepID=A0A2I0L268_PUNGR|nr:hypothetical protein CRG98_004817 [Punica granatum]